MILSTCLCRCVDAWMRETGTRVRAETRRRWRRGPLVRQEEEMHGDAVTGQPGGQGCRSVADSRVMGHEENARTWSPRRVEGREHGGCCWEMGTRALHCVSYVSLSPVSGTTRGEGQPGKPQVVQRMRPRTPRKPKTRLLERRVAWTRHFGSWILRYRGGVGIGVDGSGRAADKKHENGPGLVSEGGGLGRCIWARQSRACRAALIRSRNRGFCPDPHKSAGATQRNTE